MNEIDEQIIRRMDDGQLVDMKNEITAHLSSKLVEDKDKQKLEVLGVLLDEVYKRKHTPVEVIRHPEPKEHEEPSPASTEI